MSGGNKKKVIRRDIDLLCISLSEIAKLSKEIYDQATILARNSNYRKKQLRLAKLFLDIPRKSNDISWHTKKARKRFAKQILYS